MAKIGININTGSLDTEDPIFGIDLGTTNSLIAYKPKNAASPLVIKEADNTTLVPSVLYWNNSDFIVGDDAKKNMATDPANTIYSVKRLLGNKMDMSQEALDNLNYNISQSDTEDALVQVAVGGKYYSPIELSAKILSELKRRVKHVLGKEVKRAVITVPAYFNDTQRQATREAGKLAGIDVLRIINEPTAASLAYGIGTSSDQNKNVAIYDLGGGTFDVSILHIEDGIFEVLSTHGDTQLGGDDIDHAIIDYWLQQHPSLTKPKQLKSVAEEAKKKLSTHQDYSYKIEDTTLSLNRSQLEEILQPIIERTLQAAKQALQDASLDPVEDIDEVILVGGSTRIPLIKQSVSDYFGKPVNDTLNPDETVAIGAAIQADILAGNTTDVLLLDVTPLSLGLETMGGLMDVLLPRNSKVPTAKARNYTTQKDGQNAIIISIYQGERDLVKDNIFLGDFKLDGIPAMPAGLPKVEVKFALDTDGILHVSAKELRSGVEQQLRINPKEKLTDQMVEESLSDSIKYAEEDKQNRALLEAQTEAQVLADTTYNFIHKNSERLTAEERECLKLLTQKLESSISQGTKEQILTQSDRLNEYSAPIAERIMNSAIKDSLSGKKI